MVHARRTASVEPPSTLPSPTEHPVVLAIGLAAQFPSSGSGVAMATPRDDHGGRGRRACCSGGPRAGVASAARPMRVLVEARAHDDVAGGCISGRRRLRLVGLPAAPARGDCTAVSLLARLRAGIGLAIVEPWHYWRIEPVTRSRTSDLLDALELDLRGRHVTDLGPGNGASLVVFRNRGAETYLVERNPSLYLYCRLRGLAGRFGDILTTPLSGRTDIVYVRGSISPESFPDRDALATWLENLGGRLHIICPWRPDAAPSWYAQELDLRYRRVAPLGVQTPVYPVTWVGEPRQEA